MERRSATVERKNVGKADERGETSLELIYRFPFADLAAVKHVAKARHEITFRGKKNLEERNRHGIVGHCAHRNGGCGGVRLIWVRYRAVADVEKSPEFFPVCRQGGRICLNPGCGKCGRLRP